MNHTIAVIEADELRRMFRTVSYAADKRHAREPHRCVHLSVRDQHLTLCATDGFQLGKAWTTVEAGDTQSFGLLVDVLDVAIKMLPKIGVVEIARVEDCVTFECDGNTSHVQIMTDWKDYHGIRPSGEYHTTKIDLSSVLAACRAMKLSTRDSDRVLLEFVISRKFTQIRARVNDDWHDVTSIGEATGEFPLWSYRMQYRLFAKMATAAVLRNKYQDHRLALAPDRLALIEAFNHGHLNALHMIAPYNDRRK